MDRIIGVAVFVIGVALVTFIYHSSNAPLEQLSSTITGRYSNGAILVFAFGIAAAIGGGSIAMFGSRR